MSNEITAKLKCTIKEMQKILENKGFKLVKKYSLHDTYFIPNNLVLTELAIREILSKAILLRNINEEIPIKKTIYKLTFKKKEIDDNGNILKQDKVDCEIIKLAEGEQFLESIGYKELLQIRENDIVYEKDELAITIKDIESGDDLMEVETVADNRKLDTIEKIVNEISNLQLPIYTDNYFVKKAEIELERMLNKR